MRAVLLLVVLLSGCATQHEWSWADDPAAVGGVDPEAMRLYGGR